MRISRVAALLVAAPLAFAPAASADPIPGCYGAGGAVYCEPEPRVGGTVPTSPTLVCVSTCTYVPVPTGEVGPADVCVDYVDENGAPRSQCAQPPHGFYAVLAVICRDYNVCL